MLCFDSVLGMKWDLLKTLFCNKSLLSQYLRLNGLYTRRKCLRKLYFKIKNQLQAVSRTQQGRQREPSVKRHSVAHFLPNSGGIACWVAELNAALNLDTKRRNGNINLSKYFISSSGGRTHNQSVLQSHFVPLRHDWLLCFLIF